MTFLLAGMMFNCCSSENTKSEVPVLKIENMFHLLYI